MSERLLEAINKLNPAEAHRVSDRSIELLLDEPRRLIRITARESLRGDRDFNAVHEEAFYLDHDGMTLTHWKHADFPWAVGSNIDDCLANAIQLIVAGRSTKRGRP